MNGSYSKCRLFILLLCSLLLLFSCSSIRQIRPLEKGQSAVSLSLGGPITQIAGVYIPLPLLSLAYHRGIVTNTLDFETGLHITQLLYGVLQIDGGVNYRPWQSKQWRPGLIATPKIFISTNFEPSSFRLYPDLCLSLFWKLNERFYVYTGMENWFELSIERDDGNEQPHHWLIIPYLGINVANKKWMFQFESRVYTPNLLNTGRGPKNIGFGDYGILGVFLGVNYSFERKK